MVLALLKERFKLSYHTEERELPASTLVAAKPKLKKADPTTRTWCKNASQVPGAPPPPPRSQAMICQNITMTQFANLLRGRTPELQQPVLDSTGVEGSWDFTLTFNPVIAIQAVAARPRLDRRETSPRRPPIPLPATRFSRRWKNSSA
jgi:uncharacterized protein (TIGR03435 family)